MRRSSKGKTPPMPKPASTERVVKVTFDEEDGELLDSLCAALGVDEEEALLRGLALLSAEFAKQALLIPAYFDDEDDDEDEDDQE